MRGRLTGRLPDLVRAVVVSATCCIAAVGCGGSSTGITDHGAAAPSSKRVPVVDARQLQSTLPTALNMRSDLSEERTVKAWDLAEEPSQCQDEQWPDAWCAKATAVGLAAFTNTSDQEVGIHLISFPDERSAAQAFKQRDKSFERGRYPGPAGEPVYTLDFVASRANPLWSGKGTTFQQGTVIGQVEYSWRPRAKVPADGLLAVTRMVVQRIDEKEKGLNPTASMH